MDFLLSTEVFSLFSRKMLPVHLTRFKRSNTKVQEEAEGHRTISIFSKQRREKGRNKGKQYDFRAMVAEECG